MTTAFTIGMNQQATYWAPAGNDGFGSKVFADPVLIRCRWQNEDNIVKNVDGVEVKTANVVYPDRELSVRGFLALGDHTGVGREIGVRDTTRNVPAWEIISSGASPALHSDTVLYKVFL